ncbi:epoxide hydrolase family protein [Streptomyces sp. NPDC007896]|uniref:epoxide hydrolase family protein n=1 Tax=Streptomyces sp. NPDC007896 TaxID=3364784 RepID=UPI0036EA9456
MASPHHRLERFVIQVDQGVLDDLKTRLKATRFAPDLDNGDEKYGLSTAYLKPIVEYWADGFDWRTVEKRLNAHTHHRLDVDGTPVHFLRETGKGAAPIPLLLLHGWPWTFWDWCKVIGPLTDPAAHGGDPADAFDVIVPSLPGFGFSTPLTNSRENPLSMADRFHTLMTSILGHDRFAVGGVDLGALIAAQLGHKHTSSLYGIHLDNEIPLNLFQGQRYWDFTGGAMITVDMPVELRADLIHFQDTYVSHLAAHMLDGQTITHAFSDSPVGMLAWLLRRWKKWSDRNGVFEDDFPLDHILTNATIYWANQAIGSSIRAYKNANLYPWQPSHDRTPPVEAPAGFTLLLGDISEPGARTPEHRREAFGKRHVYADVRDINVHQKGGHFGPWENPEAWINDLRSTFRPLRP